MILLDPGNTHLRSAAFLIVGVLGSLCSAGEGDFPRTLRELRESFDRHVSVPHGAFVFSVFPDGLSHLDRNGALHLAEQIRRYEGVAPRRATRPRYPEPDVYLVDRGGGYRIWVGKWHSCSGALEGVFKELQGRIPEAARLSTSPIVGPVYPEPPRWFLGMQWKGKPIGQFSFGKRFGGWEGHALYSVTFLRRNMLITVEGHPQGDAETPLDPDPREIALKLDSYYTADPLEHLPADETRRRKTLEISVDSQEPIVSGREYGVHFALTSAGQRPVEIRIRVTGGEVWEVPRESAKPRRPGEWVPVEERDYFVQFSEAAAQTLTCYHINEEGECMAWGVLEVDVSQP